MSLGILGGNGAGKKVARPLGYSFAGLGLGAMEFCPAPCTANPDPEVKRYQSMMNTDLRRMNYNQVLVDGKIGKGTCGLDMFFSQVPQLFQTARASWDDDLAFRVHTACSGKPFALPSPIKKTDSVFVDDKDDPVCKSQSIPWGQSSIKDPHGTGTITVRTSELNMQLDELGYEPISSSTIDATTCGAMKLIDALNNTHYLCQPGFFCKDFVAPKKKSTPVPVAAPVLVATPANTNLPTTPPTTKAASMATTGIIVGVLGVGAYFLGKNKGWF
jgi:hypothetical protein